MKNLKEYERAYFISGFVSLIGLITLFLTVIN